MAPGDLMDLSAGEANKQHLAAVTRNYISQPRISMPLSLFSLDSVPVLLFYELYSRQNGSLSSYDLSRDE